MRKNGITDRLKSSRLVVHPASEPMSTDTLPSSAVIPDRESRVVSDIRTRGVPKSGRIWKRVKTQRFSKIRNDKPDTTSWSSKVKGKSDKAAIKLYAETVKAEKLEREKVERERVAEKRKKKLENEKKNEIVVPIKNVAKIKRMRKKQLRSIVKL